MSRAHTLPWTLLPSVPQLRQKVIWLLIMEAWVRSEGIVVFVVNIMALGQVLF